MHLSHRFCSRLVLLTAALLGSAWAASQSDAEDALQWKFTKGEKLDYVMTQNMDMSMNAGPQGQMKMTMKQQMDMTWEVQGIEENGNAKISQSIDRIQMKMSGPQDVEYDSQSKEAPQGLAAMIAPSFDALTKGKFVLTMTPLGEIVDVVVPQEVVDALKNTPGAKMLGEMGSAEGLKQMMSQGSMVLPKEMPEKGSQWTHAMEIKMPMGGTQKTITTYTYEGTKDVDGTTYAVVKPTVKTTYEGNGAMTLTVKDQKSSGEILFDPKAGRMASSNLDQDMTLDVNVSGQALSQSLHQVVEVKITPAK